MRTVKTTEDGWDCCPELKEVVDHIECMDHALYEINRCVRTCELDQMVDELKTHLMDALEALDEIDTSVVYETVGDEDDDDDYDEDEE
jgi:hypothetical protein